MANIKLPDPLSRRHLLEGGLDAGKALALAEAYLEAGREVEAIDFLAAAGGGSDSAAREALLGLRSAALERGDVFLLRVVSGALDEEATCDDWQSLAEAAKRAGRLEDAESAERLATVRD